MEKIVRRFWYKYDTPQKDILAETMEDAVCVCNMCKVVYKERPFICACKSNVFLKDI